MSWQRAHHVAGFDACFGLYLRGLLRRNFARIAVRGDLPSRGFVAVANHHSWWDGLIPYYVHHHDRRTANFAVMMSDRELRRFPFFRLGGAFSIDASSVRSAREAVQYAGDLAGAGTSVWIFPDGELRPPSVAPAFTSGFVHAARAGGVDVVPVAMRFAMLAKQRPEAFLSFGAPFPAIERDAQARAQDEVVRLLASIDSDIRTGAVDAYRVVLRGRAGADDTLGAVTRRIVPSR